MLALLAVSAIMVSLGTLCGPENNVVQAKKHTDPAAALKALNKLNSKASSVSCPSITMGMVSKSSLFYDKGGDLLFSTWFLGFKEAAVACKGDTYWFWIRSFDKKSFYFCDRGKLDSTDLRPLMKPEVISLIGWIGEISPSSPPKRSPRGFCAETRKGFATITTEFDETRILSQSFSSGGVPIVTMTGEDYKRFSGLNMPTIISVAWHEEGISEDFHVADWIINPNPPEIHPPEGTTAVDLEEFRVRSSSSTKSESSSFFPILDGRWR